MTELQSKSRVGPAERFVSAERLRGHVVDSGQGQPRILGYDLEGDLARHYAPHEVLFLLLAGELPTQRQGQAFSVAMQFLSSASVADADVHAAVLTRICGSPPAGMTAATATACGEFAGAVLAEHAPLLAWLGDSGRGELPAPFRASNDIDDHAVDRLRSATAPAGPFVILQARPRRISALIGVLYECGIRLPDALHSAIVMARLPVALAEGRATAALDFRGYPLNVPRFHYVDEP